MIWQSFDWCQENFGAFWLLIVPIPSWKICVKLQWCKSRWQVKQKNCGPWKWIIRFLNTISKNPGARWSSLLFFHRYLMAFAFLLVPLWSVTSLLDVIVVSLLGLLSAICSVLFCSGCHNKIIQAEWFKQQQFIFQQFWKLQVWDQGNDIVRFWCELFLAYRLSFCCVLT